MSIRRLSVLTTARVSTYATFSFLPDDGGEGSIAAANEEVSGAIESWKRKRGEYYYYDATLRVKIAK